MKSRVQKFLKNTRRFILQIPIGNYRIKQATIVILSPIIILVCVVIAAIDTLFEKIKHIFNQNKFIDICYIMCIISVCLTLTFIYVYSEIYEIKVNASSNDAPIVVQSTKNDNTDYTNNSIQSPIIEKPISVESSSNITTEKVPETSIPETTISGTTNITTTDKTPETSIPSITTDKIPETSIPEIDEKPEITVSEYTTHIIALNDNFYKLSKKYYGNTKYYKALMEYNKYNENDILHIGDKIIIPNIEDKEFIDIYNRIDNVEREEIDSFVESTKGQTIQAGTNNTYKYGVRTDPAVDISIPSGNLMKNYTGEVDTSKFKLLGNYSTTGYTPKCIHCCGNDKGIGAAGVPIICGYSVATPDNIPLGTTLYIEGYGFYVVEDRGNFGYTNIDIACPTHEECALVTNMTKEVKVYIVTNN